MTYGELELQAAIDFIAEQGGTFAADDGQIHPENAIFQLGAYEPEGVLVGAVVIERLGQDKAELAAIASSEPNVTGPLIGAAQGEAADRGLTLSIAKWQAKLAG